MTHETIGMRPPSPGGGRSEDGRGGQGVRTHSPLARAEGVRMGEGGQGGEGLPSPSPVRGGGPAAARERGPGGEGSFGGRPWICRQCHEDQVAFGAIPADLLCHTCHDAQRAATAFTEADAGIPKLLRGLTRESWSTHFERPWPQALEHWTGTPRWVAMWGPTGTGKTGIATILLAEHLRTGRRGRWISGPELARRIQRDLIVSEEVIAPLLVTPLLVLDEPLSGAAADWYMERLILITRTRDESCLPTVITSQVLPELLRNPNAAMPPSLLSRWLSGLHVRTGGTDVRLRKATR